MVPLAIRTDTTWSTPQEGVDRLAEGLTVKRPLLTLAAAFVMAVELRAPVQQVREYLMARACEPAAAEGP